MLQRTRKKRKNYLKSIDSRGIINISKEGGGGVYGKIPSGEYVW